MAAGVRSAAGLSPLLQAFAFNYISKHAKRETAETGTGGSDFMPALQGYRDATARHVLP